MTDQRARLTDTRRGRISRACSATTHDDNRCQGNAQGCGGTAGHHRRCRRSRAAPDERACVVDHGAHGRCTARGHTHCAVGCRYRCSAGIGDPGGSTRPELAPAVRPGRITGVLASTCCQLPDRRIRGGFDPTVKRLPGFDDRLLASGTRHCLELEQRSGRRECCDNALRVVRRPCGRLHRAGRVGVRCRGLERGGEEQNPDHD